MTKNKIYNIVPVVLDIPEELHQTNRTYISFEQTQDAISPQYQTEIDTDYQQLHDKVESNLRKLAGD